MYVLARVEALKLYQPRMAASNAVLRDNKMTVWFSLLTKKRKEAFPSQIKLELTHRTAIQPPFVSMSVE